MRVHKLQLPHTSIIIIIIIIIIMYIIFSPVNANFNFSWNYY
jgi:hypothetical protein